MILNREEISEQFKLIPEEEEEASHPPILQGQETARANSQSS